MRGNPVRRKQEITNYQLFLGGVLLRGILTGSWGLLGLVLFAPVVVKTVDGLIDRALRG